MRLSAFAGTALLLLIFLPACACAQSQNAEITAFTGSVEVKLKDIEDPAPAEEGMQLEAGDTLRTAAGASCELSFNTANTNIVRVSENTALKVLFSGDEKLEMTGGEVFSSVSELPSGSAFEIRTPTAVSGARGTDWVTTVSGELTEVEAIDKTPYVRHFESPGTRSREEMLIPAGQMTSIRRFQRPAAARAIAGARLQRWQDRKQMMRRNGQQALIRRGQKPAFNRGDFKQKMRQSMQKKPVPKRVIRPVMRDGGVKK